MSEMIIYRIYNKVNSKCYIGQSVNSFNERYRGGKWWEHTHNEILINSIHKYGIDSFDFEILEENVETIEKLNDLEKFYAQKFNSYRPHGYNIRGCGDNRFVDDELKLHLSTFRKGTNYVPKNKKSSIYKGVYWRERKKSWQVRFDNNQLQKIKYCNSEIEAAETYDKISLYIFGDKAYINFEEKRSDYLLCGLEKFYNDFFSTKKRRKYPTKDDSDLLYLITPMIWKMSVPEISKKINITERRIHLCIKKHKIESPSKNYWQKINQKND
jgi:group I intron endonuclease